MGDFIKSNFDKLLLSLLVMLFVGVMIYSIHRPDLDDDKIISFCQDMAKLFAGALLTLITGVVLRKANGIAPSGGSNETQPPSAPANPGSHL